MDTLSTIIVDLLNEKNASDVEVIDLKGKTVIADRFILATGRSTTNVRAIADFVEEELSEKHGVDVIRREGREEAQWVVLDYGSDIVHIFTEPVRKTYSLEKLWSGNSSEEG